MVNNKKLNVLFLGLCLCGAIVNTFAMECFHHKPKKVKTEGIAERIDPSTLPSLEGEMVLWKKNESDYYAVRLGKRIGNTSQYQIYHDGTAGTFCSPEELYQYK